MKSSPDPSTSVLTTPEARVTDLVVRLGFLGLFAYWSLTLVLPFLPIVISSVVLTAALYPAYAWLRDRMWGRGSVAAFLITLLGVAVVIGPIAVLVNSLASTLQVIAAGLSSGTLAIPQPPEVLRDWPFVGEHIDKAWRPPIWKLPSQNMARFCSPRES